MKYLFLPVLAALALSVTSCSTDTPSSQQHSAATEETEPTQVPPHRGMTKAEVHKLYGDPDNIRAAANGEVWYYFFNKAMYYIPFYVSKPRTASFVFDSRGILVDFQYNG